MMGDHWRRYKLEITTKIKEANKDHNKAHALALIRPAFKDDWANSVKQILSLECEVG